MPFEHRNAARRWKSPLTRAWGAVLVLALLCVLMPEDTPAGEEPAPAESVPVAPSPPPPPAEQLLAPVPSQFNWMRREVRPNPLLEALMQLTERPPQLLMSVSLTEEYSDNFFLSERNQEEEFRTGLDLGTIYRLEGGRGFLSLANSVGVNYEVRADRVNLPFVNLALNTGYQFPRLSLSLNETFIRSDDVQDASPTGLRAERRIFLRNSVIPQLRYDLSRTTAVSLAYNNTMVWSGGNGGNEADVTGGELGDSSSHSVSGTLQHWFSRNLSSSFGYSFVTITSDESGDRLSHSGSTDFSYLIDARTSAALRAFGVLTDRSEGELDSRIYGMSVGLQRQLTSLLSLYVAAGPVAIEREGRGTRLFPNWEISLDGGIPLTRRTNLRISTRQNIDNTAGDVDDVGLVLSQSAAVTLSHALSRDLLASIFGTYSRTELLEDTSSGTSTQGEKFSYWNAGARMSYALTRVLLLNVTYRYQQRDSEDTGGQPSDDRFGSNYQENRVMVTLSAAFRLF
jgi:opacity protein-like surface antigen